MRILLFGMQSSGASLITYFLGQHPDSVALVDVWIRHLTPPLANARATSVIAKCTVSTLFDFTDHERSFRPDRTVLVLRDPVQNYASLMSKDYVAEGGEIDEKFALMEDVFKERDRFDLTIAYEDFVARPGVAVEQFREAGIPADPAYYDFRRSVKQIRSFNFKHDPWCRERYGLSWGFGNVQGRQLNPQKLYKPATDEVRDCAATLCPSLSSYYQQNYNWIADLQVQPQPTTGTATPPGLRQRIPGLRRTGTS